MVNSALNGQFVCPPGGIGSSAASSPQGNPGPRTPQDVVEEWQDNWGCRQGNPAWNWRWDWIAGAAFRAREEAGGGAVCSPCGGLGGRAPPAPEPHGAMSAVWIWPLFARHQDACAECASRRLPICTLGSCFHWNSRILAPASGVNRANHSPVCNPSQECPFYYGTVHNLKPKVEH